MDQLDVSLTPRGGLHIEGFPDAVKVIRLATPIAARACDLALHAVDLDFAARCLSAINQQTDVLVRQALWRSAIVHFFRCFGRGVRFPLRPAEVFKGDAEGVQVFEYFQQLRNKHFVHDENPYTQSVAGAILNHRSAERKVGKIVTLCLIGETLDQGHWSNLDLLTRRARSWVTAEYERVCDRITEQLEAEPYEDLEGRDGIVPPFPGQAGQAGMSRPR